MDFQIVWGDRALTDLELILRPIAANDPDAAERLRAELVASVEVLERFPFIGPAYERDRTGRGREILCRNYRIFYRVQEAAKRVDILTIRHSSRQEPRLP